VLKKRLIFALLWRSGKFCLSRNFKLQQAGDLAWIEKNYNFKVIASSIDELVVLNVTRGEKEMATFAGQVAELTRGCFVPLAAGGGIRSIDDAVLLLRSGADKLVINTPLVQDPALVSALAQRFGRQCVVASIDYRKRDGKDEVFVENGTVATGMTVAEAVSNAERLGAGEVYLTSMDQDGTGQGYDTATLEQVAARSRVPVIASGGVGKFEHLAGWLAHPWASAAATANIFNFLGEGLREARMHIEEQGIPLATWDFTWKG
jgi:cyclase